MNDPKDEPFLDEGEELDFKLFENLKSARLKEGYREGIIAGKEAELQKGFDDGHPVGFAAAYKIGQLTGTLKAIVRHIRLAQSAGNLVVEELDLKRLHEDEEKLSKLQQRLNVDIIPQSVAAIIDKEPFSQGSTSVDNNIQVDISNYIQNELDQELESVKITCREILLKLNQDVAILDF